MLVKPVWCWIVIVPAAFVAGLFIVTQGITLTSEAQQAQPNTSAVNLEIRREKHAPITAKGVYLTAYSAANRKKLDSIIDLINTTELNTVVIDIKDYSGVVLYDSSVALVNELKADEKRLGDVRAMIKHLHDQDIYVIARQTVFQDPLLARKKPEWAIKNKSGGIWYDRKGLSWVDPTRREVWEYNMAIAKEAIALGFDEINFDYVRFPTDGNLSAMVYTIGNKKRYEVMREFYEFLDTEFEGQPAWLSIDVFGMVMEATGENDMQIGQRLADMVDNVDYISPMMYPSHYPSGHLKLENPAAYPGTVIDHGMKKGMPVAEGKRAKIRPWLQAFNLGAVYTAEKIRAQIDKAEKYTDAGWLLWNASNRYTGAGLRKQ